jgi:glyoxylase-like metal-dependent hydrolase (beta-lactamase superfamily II)
MRIHHLSCGSMCPYGGHLWDGVTPGLGPATIVCHCLLIEAADSLVLVDTGFGLGDVAQPQRLSAFFRNANRVRLDAEQTARRQVERLGLRPDDVRHIVLTHLDFDHAGGIEDFPNATVHVMDAELRAATLRPSPLDRQRYRPAQWDDATRWRRYRADGERWFGFECVRDLTGLPLDILMVPLAGHTVGHAGIAINGPDGWKLHAGDAYFYHGEMDPRGYHCTPMLRAYQKLMEVDREVRLWNQQRLRNLKQRFSGEITLFCAHDPSELEAVAARPPALKEAVALSERSAMPVPGAITS